MIELWFDSDRWLGLAAAQSVQIAVLVLVIALIARWLARDRPHVARVLWLVVLAKCLTPPLWSSPSGVFCWLQEPVVVESTDTSPTTLASSGLLPLDPSRRPSTGNRLADKRIPLTLPTNTATLAAAPYEDAKLGEPSMDVERPWFRAAAWAKWLAAIWLVVAAGMVAVNTIRWLLFVRRLREAPREDFPGLDELAVRLARQLRLRVTVRVLVTHSRIGPAVVGLVRPTILLPHAIVAGKTLRELEPILVHELLHVRRGDLWIALVQTLAQSLWWFHPLVWWAGRMINREAERSCDEEAIAELGCEPARYARTLLDVLECKQRLRAVPAFPGVRPVDVTSSRLERIMKLGHGCHRRTPWWCWGLMIGVAIATLPGAAFVTHAKDRGSNVERKRALRAGARVESSATSDQWVAPAAPKLHAGASDATPPTPSANADQFVIQVRVISGDLASIDQLPIHWQLPTRDDDVQPAAVAAADPRVDAAEAASAADASRGTKESRIHATATVERPVHVLSATLDAKATAKVVERAESQANLNVLMAPRVVVFDGQAAQISDEVQRPFVVGFRDKRPADARDGEAADNELEPIVRVVNAGTNIRLQPHGAGTNIGLDCTVALADIRRVDVRNVLRGPGRRPLKVQSPEVTSQRVNASVSIPVDSTFAIGGLQMRDAQGTEQSLIILVNCHKVPKTLGVGLNSDAGVTGELVFEVTAEAAPDAEQPDARTDERRKLEDRLKQLPQPVVVSPQVRIVEQEKCFELWGRQIHLKSRDKNSTRWSMKADQGVAQFFKDGERTQLRLKGSVVLAWESDEMLATADAVDISNTSIQLEGNARWRDSAATLAADRILISQLFHRVELSGRAVMTRPGPDGPTTIRAERIVLDSRTGEARAESTAEVELRGAKPAEMTLRVYAVADLVVPIPGALTAPQPAADTPRAAREAKRPAVPDMQPLIGLIRATIAPDSWREGMIVAKEDSLSLVIRQTSDVHQKIDELLGQLRKLYDVQVVLTLRAIESPDDGAWSRLGIDMPWTKPGTDDWRPASATLSAAQTAAVQRELVAGKPAAAKLRLVNLPKVTLFNSQSANLSILGDDDEHGGLPMHVVPLISASGDAVRLNLSLGAQDADDVLRRVSNHKLSRGESLVLDITSQLSPPPTAKGVPLLDKIPYTSRLFTNPKVSTSPRRVYLFVQPQVIDAAEAVADVKDKDKE